MSAALSAIDRARPMLVAIGGPRGWSDTKDHWRNKLARKVGLNARRVRAILSGEQVRLTADEYLTIQERFEALDRRLAEDLAALAGTDRPSPSGVVRAGGEAHPRADRAGEFQEGAGARNAR